ncbi:MAG: restriction endonuclease subunit S [Aquabacterium sp.]|nr:restriction endonuclease subunit S [Aquabacterium sp.]
MKIEVDLPPLEEQERIAAVRFSLVDKIDLNRRINETLEAMAQAIFKSWFVDFDPVKAKIAAKAEDRDPLRATMSAISGKADAELDALPSDQHAQLAATAALFPDEMEESELGEIPKGWCAAPFGSMLTHTIGGDWGAETPDASNDTRVAIIRGTDLPDLDQALSNRVPIRYTSQKKLATRRLQMGDIILEVSGGSRDQPTGRSFRMTANAMREFDCPVEPASFCRLLRPASTEIGVILGLHLSYIYQQGKTWEYQNQSTGIANFQTTHFLETELVPKPPTAVIDAFFKTVNPLLERRHDPQGKQLVALRDTLLPKLLSGELMIQKIEAETEA